MRLLLDTNVIIFWLNANSCINDNLKQVISSPENTCYLSSASIWELEIKINLGKLTIPKSYIAEINNQAFIELPISFIHAQATRGLPNFHKDPFDRLLIAQALVEELTIITFDKNYNKYPAKLLEF